MNSRLNVALLDDHPLVLRGLESALQQDADIEVVGAFTRSILLFDLLEQQRVDAVLLDLKLSIQDLDGFQVLERIRYLQDGCRVIILSAYNSLSSVTACHQAGAHGFIGKREPMDRLPGRIRRACQRSSEFFALINTDAHGQVAPAAAWLNDAIAKLTPSERAVIERVLRGMSTSQIASDLGRAKTTISTQKTSALGKLNMTSERELFQMLPKLGEPVPFETI